MDFTREDTLPKPSSPAAPLQPDKPRRSRRVRASHGPETYVAARGWAMRDLRKATPALQQLQLLATCQYFCQGAF